MSNSASNQTVGLKEKWPIIDKHREAISTEIENMAQEERGSSANKLRILSKWFKQSRPFEDALKRADVLAICLPLCSSRTDEAGFHNSDIQSAIRTGFSSIVQNSSSSQHLMRATVYPLLILVAGLFLAIGFSCFVAPGFEEMFDEFGIQLPFATTIIMSCASFLRRWAFVFVFWLVGGALLFWLFSYIENKRRQSHLSWLDNRMMGSRDALADWSWHLSLLLESGVAQPQAIWNAGYASGKAWLKQMSILWSQPKQLTEGAKRSYLSGKYRLLDHALMIPNSDGKIQLLRRVATYYRSRNRNIGRWLISWLVLGIYWLIGFVAFFSLMAIFMPLVAIVSGLTGGF